METLVALAVFATAATGLIALNTNTVRISRELTERSLARQVAENVAVDTVTIPSLQVIGKTEGSENQRRIQFDWERSIAPTPRSGLIQIEILVRRNGNDAVLSQLSLLHLTEPET